MQELFDALKNIHRLPSEVQEDIASGLEKFTWEPGFKPVKVGQINRYIYFVKSGLVYIRWPNEPKSVINWILGKGDFVIIPSAFATQELSNEELVAAEEVVAFGYTHEKLEKTCERHTIFNTHYKLINGFYRKQDAERVQMLAMSADQRLDWLWTVHPDYFSRLTVEVICEYLCISAAKYHRYHSQRRGKGKI